VNSVRTPGAAPSRRPRRATAVAVGGVLLLGGVVTVGVALLPELRFGYREPRLHVVVETTAALVASLLALLALGRFQRSRALPDVLLAATFVLLVAVNTTFSAVPAAVLDGASPEATWGRWPDAWSRGCCWWGRRWDPGAP
jgi:hypothetical protein